MTRFWRFKFLLQSNHSGRFSNGFFFLNCRLICVLCLVFFYWGCCCFWTHMSFETVTIVFLCLVCSGVIILWGHCLCFCFVFVCFAVHMCLSNGFHLCLFVWFVLVFLYCGASRSLEGNSRLLLAMNINIRLRPHHTIVTIFKVQLSQLQSRSKQLSQFS